MPLRETRRFKTKGFVISFGDFMLPVVGLVAIGLLLVAGKIFFFDLPLESQPVPVPIGPPSDVPRLPVNPDTPRADAGEERASRSPVEAQPVAQPETPTQITTAGGNLVLDLDHNNTNTTQDNADTVPNDSPHENAAQGGDSDKREEIIVVAIPAPKPEAKPTPPKPETQPKPTRSTEPKPAAPKPVEPEKPAIQRDKINWMVQIGAFSTKAAAETVLKKVTQAGYTATVVSGTTLHRVLVQAGPTRQNALNLATQLGQVGFPGAFVVPPRQ